MKKIAFLVVMSIGMMASAQEKNSDCKCPHHFDKEKMDKVMKKAKSDWDKANIDWNKAKEALEKARSLKDFGKGDIHQFLEETKIKRILEELKISEPQKEEARKLFEQYFKEKKELLEPFKKGKKKLEELSNEEALERIKVNFDTAQKMLDFRKKYTDIFLQKYTPKEVIKIYQIEKNMMDFVKKKHEELKQK